MKTIKLPSNVGQLFITGDIHGEFKEMFHHLKNNVKVKDDDMDSFMHPMEQENNKRLENEALEIEERMRTGYRPSEHEYKIYSRYRYLKDSKKSNKQRTYAYSNSAIIVAGDCGFGFNKKGYYTDLLERYNKILQYNNTHIFFVRGNHDDPSYFDGEMVNYSNIKAVEDYTIIEAIGYRLLCVGGAISSDRTWRLEQEKRINRFKHGDNKKKLYWPNENIVFDKDKILDALKDGAKVDIVVTHSAPSFVDPQCYIGIDKWLEADKDLKNDVDNERIIHDRIFETLRDNESRPKLWVHGHFDYSSEEKRANSYFISLEDGFNPLNVGEKMTELFEPNLKKKQKDLAGKKIIKSKKEINISSEPPTITRFRPDAFRTNITMPDMGRNAPYVIDVEDREINEVEDREINEGEARNNIYRRLVEDFHQQLNAAPFDFVVEGNNTFELG